MYIQEYFFAIMFHEDQLIQLHARFVCQYILFVIFVWEIMTACFFIIYSMAYITMSSVLFNF